MKRILLVAVIALCGIAAQAQNKIFEKYAKMEGVEYVCINQAMFSAGLSIATGGQVVVDEANTQGTDLSKLKLAKDKDYELLMQSHSADGNDATFLHNEKANPNEFIICNIREEDCSVVVLLKDK